jgi:hypothetical protein
LFCGRRKTGMGVWILDVTIAEGDSVERPWDERECVEPKRVTGGKIMSRWRRPAQPREAEGRRRSGGNGDGNDDGGMIGEVKTSFGWCQMNYGTGSDD